MAKKYRRFLVDSEEYDPAKRAERQVSEASKDVDVSENMVIVDEKLRERQEEELAEQQQQEAEKITVVEASTERKAKPLVERVSSRQHARILILTKDQSVFTDGSSALQRVLELANMFVEVHVIVLSDRNAFLPDTKRIGESAWVYSAPARWWFMTVWSARNVAKKQLLFGGGFRPDVIIADDPFESGLAGLLLAWMYDRPFQVHVEGDFFEASFKDKAPHNVWRVRIANLVLRRTPCIRTRSEYMRRRIVERYKKEDSVVELLPVYYDLKAWRDAIPAIDLKKQYPQFKFTLLHVSSMNRLSHTAAVIDGLFYILRQYPTIGLVVLGDGTDRSALEKRVRDYGLSNQIVFESMPDDTLSYIKTANAVIHTSEETSLDYVVLQTAAVETPMVCGSSGIAAELLIDGESVLLCPTDSPPCFGEKVNQLLNDNALRKKIALNAKDEVFERTSQDYASYMDAYRASIERCLVSEEHKAA